MVAPGPLVASATVGVPETRVHASAANPAACSCLIPIIGVIPRVSIASIMKAIMPPDKVKTAGVFFVARYWAINSAFVIV